MIYAVGTFFLFLGMLIGYLLSRADYGSRVENGLILFLNDEGEWEGHPEALRDVRKR